MKNASFNIVCVFIIVLLLFVSVFTFNATRSETKTYRDFKIEEMDAQYEWDESHENKFETYRVTNNSEKNFKCCRIRVTIKDGYGSKAYCYTDTFSIKAGKTKVIKTHTFGEMEKESDLPNRIVYVVAPKVEVKGENGFEL
ncbi:MAG: hypothetical protein IKF64_05005 [Eubacterium sp.]|nr:hypothetical protein [Eubacterium sp.]